jgi:ABC-type polysaccharide/polyol phosphate export permease
MAQTAALNLLHRSYGRTAAGLRWATRASNLVLLALASVASVVTRATLPERIFLLGVLAGLFLLSFTATAHTQSERRS